MHTPLDSHLHTPKGNEIIQKLIDCQKTNGKWKQLIFHSCDQLDYEMRMCTRQERIDRTNANIESARTRNAEIKENLRKMKAEGKTWRDS